MARGGGVAEEQRRGCPVNAAAFLLVALGVVGLLRRQLRAVAAAVTGRRGAAIVLVAGVLELVLRAERSKSTTVV